MIVAVVAEKSSGEQRVALVPETVRRLTTKKISVHVEKGAGESAHLKDDDYRRCGAEIEQCRSDLLKIADVLVRVGLPKLDEIDELRTGAVVISPLFLRQNPELIEVLKARNITSIALENLPRKTALQAMDVLSSQSTAAGYRAVIVAANALGKFFPLLMTPAGTIAPARVLVLGAGVAGLQAIATAKRLGAVVDAFDVRPVVRQEVESLGARFVESAIDEIAETSEGYARRLSSQSLALAHAAIQRVIAGADVCVTAAMVPNERAPVLITAEMIDCMRPGSVIVDLAAAQGGNCVLTQAGKDIVANDITIIGRLNLAAEVALDASRMHSRNIEKLIEHFYHDGRFQIDFTDEIARKCVVVHAGKLIPIDGPAV